jgi:hypothetical protein
MIGMVGTAALIVVSGALAQEEPIRLFNGKDLSGWKGDPRRWSVEDGAITGRTTPDTLLNYNTFLIWQEGKPANFELTWKYRIVGGNSGLQYRSEVIDPQRFVVKGYQADIDSGTTYTGMNYEERGRAFLAERGQKVEVAPDGTRKVVGSLGDKGALQAHVKNEDWNEYRVVAQGNHLRHYVNGVQMSEVIDQQADKAATEGVIALQLHAGPPMTVQFKDISLKELKAP